MRSRRFGLIATMALLAGTSALAQRGGYRAPTASYTGNVPYDGRFVFVRLSYPWYNGRLPYWAHDYPDGETNFLKILSEITATPAHVNESSIMSLSDPEIFKFPVIYMAEPGFWSMTDDEAKSLRAYLQKGGYLILDDDRYNHWGNIDLQVSRLFPEGRWFDLDGTSAVFNSFFSIPHPENTPQYYDPAPAYFKGMFEDNNPQKRMMIMLNYSTDISEFWEWSNKGTKPISEDNWAFKVGVNEFMYGIIH